MELVIVGSVAYDDLATDAGEAEGALGGSATYAGLSAAFHSRLRDPNMGGPVPVGLVGVVGDDFRVGDWEMLESRGLDLSGIERAEGSTFRWRGRYHGSMDEAETLETQLNVFGEFEPKIPAGWTSPEVLFCGNIHPAIQAAVLDSCTEAKFTALDSMNLWIEIQRAALEQVVAQTDLLFLNDAEALAFTGAASLDAAGAALLTAGPRFVVIKRGAKGATLFHADGNARIPAHPARQFIDPTGAGDTFAGAACGWLAERNLDANNLVEALHHGAALASATVEGLGTTALLALTAEGAKQRRAALTKR